MPRVRTYLDFNATSPLRPGARARMIEMLDLTGNPSSIHAEGRRARAAVETARAEVAQLVGARADLIVFTSGTTEAAALALTPELRDAPGQGPVDRLLIGATEHPAIAQGHRFAVDRVEMVAVRPDGTLDLAALGDALAAAPGRAVLALQAANSETGVIQPVAEAADLVHARGGLLVCDATQGAGRIDCRFETLRADIILLSAHKIGGPLGAGALARRSDHVRIGAPLVRGGGQERGLRGGTENVPAIAGFGAAAREVAALDEALRLNALRANLEARLKGMLPDLVIFGEAAPRLPNNVAFAVPGVAKDTLLIGLDLEGFAVSTGSACSSGKVSTSHVLEAMGVDTHLRDGLIRVSLGWSSSSADIDRFAEALGTIIERIKRRSKQAAA